MKSIKEIIKEEISEFNKTVFQDVPQDLYVHFRQTKFSDDANRSHMKVFRAKDQRDFLIKKTINEDIFKVYDFNNLNSPIAVAVFDVHNDYFTGYEHRQSIEVNPLYRRIGIATALTDFAENIYNLPYKASNLQSTEMQAFTKNRMSGETMDEVGSNTNQQKLYYHGRSSNRPYSGKYIYITDSLGYASGYSDGKELYTYTVPFGTNRIFSMKNPQHVNLLRKYLDDYTIQMIFNSSGQNQEMDWAALSYISTDDFEQAEDLFEHLGFLAIRLKERQDVDSMYVFDQKNLDFQGVIDITSPEYQEQIRQFYKDFAKDKNFLEGVGDKYAEKAFGIPDTTKGQQQVGEKPFKTMTIFTPEWMGGEHAGKTEMIPVYLNPRSLQGFQDDVRAISDAEGNLYVAQLDGNFIHSDMGNELGLTTKESFSSVYHRMKEFQLLHRVGNENAFGLADSSTNQIKLDTQSKKTGIDLLRKAKQKNPQFEYYPEYYRNVEAYDTDPIDASGNDIYADSSYYDQDEDNIGDDNQLISKDLASNPIENIVREEILKLSEVGEGNAQPYKWSLMTNDDKKITYEFITDSELIYIVTFGRDLFKGNENIYDAFFSVEEPFGRYYDDADSLNRNEMYKIMSTLILIFKDFVEKKNPEKIIIDPAKKDYGDFRRMNLYLAYIGKHLSKGYTVRKEDDSINIEKTENLMETDELIKKGNSGDCYKNVQDYLLDNDLPNAFIVHGEVTSRNGTNKHAWIEDGDDIYDPTTGIRTDREKYYRILKPIVYNKYSFPEAMKLRFSQGHYGPY